MLSGYRNNILIVGLLLSLALLSLLIFLLNELRMDHFNFSLLQAVAENRWWFHYNQYEGGGLQVTLNILALQIFILPAAFFMRILFRKTAAPELFFYIIFLLSLSFEGFRVFTLFLRYTGASPQLPLLTTRLVYWSRLFGLASLLCSSLYAAELKYQKFISVLGLMAVLCFLVAYSLPLDSSIFLSSFLYRLGDEGGLLFVQLGLLFFSLVNFVIAAIKRNPRYLYLLLAIFLAAGGREILLFGNSLATLAAGLVLLLGGTLLFSRQVDKMYIWS